MNELKPEDVMRAWEWNEHCAKMMGSFTASYTEIHAILALLREKDAEHKELWEERCRIYTSMREWEEECKRYRDALREKDAEIERLTTENCVLQKRLDEAETNIELLEDTVDDVNNDEVEQLEKLLSMERAEAITEFAKELTSELIKGSIYPVFVKGAIERTEKKLKGEVL